jgi:RNA polymerase sigma-70 factor, ECF subfamily
LQEPGNTDDWNVFFSIYQPFVQRHLLRRKVRQVDVDDVTQEILSRVFSSIATFTHNGRTGAFRKWLGQIVSQQTWRYFQALQKEAKITAIPSMRFDDQAEFESDFEAQWELEHDQYCLGRLLELIRPEFTQATWQAFQMIVLQGLPTADVSHSLNVSVNAVVISKSRVLRRLRTLGKDLVDFL